MTRVPARSGAARAVLATAALALVAALPVGAQSAEDDLDLLSRAGEARAIGPDTAKVVLIEFLDFACATCQAFHVERGDSLRRALPPDVRLVYVNYLLPRFLRGYHAAEAATCASAVGGRDGYTAMADRLLRNPDEWSAARDPGPVFTRYAREAGLDATAFADCRARDLTAPLIVSDMETGSRFGVAGTPTFVAVPRGAEGPDDAFYAGGNVSIAELMELIGKAREKAR